MVHTPPEVGEYMEAMMPAVTIGTDLPVGDGKLTDEQMGTLTRLGLEVFKRIRQDKGTGPVNFEFVRAVLQGVIEGRIVFPPEGSIAKDPPHMVFRRPSEKERAKSTVPYGTMLAHWNNRLKMPQRMPENVMAELWEAENIPRPEVNYGTTPIDHIFETDETVTGRDRQVVGATLQWLATSEGLSFLRRFLREANLARQMC